MIGVPTETKEDRQASLALIKKFPEATVELTTYRPYPGTELYEYCIREGLFSPPENTLEWARISDQYDPRFAVSDFNWREIWSAQLKCLFHNTRSVFIRSGRTNKLAYLVNISPLLIQRIGFYLYIPPHILKKISAYSSKLISQLSSFYRKLRKSIKSFKSFFSPPEKKIYILNVESSRNCNLRCIQCANHSIFSPKVTGNKLMTLETFKKLEPVIPYIKIINLDNHGEPLLNPYLTEMIKFAKCLNPQVRISFTTNLQTLTEKLAKGLLESGLTDLQVSINGITKETYEKIEVNAKFDRLLQNLEIIKTYRKYNRNNLHILTTCFTSNKLNLDELPYLPKFCSKYGFDIIRINSLQVFHEENTNISLYNSAEDIKYTRKIYNQTKQNAELFGIRIYIVELYPEDRFVCSYPVNSVSISYSGKVSPCWMFDLEKDYFCFFRSEKIKIPHISFGNINETDFWKIWNKKEYKYFRANFKKGKYPICCRKCPVGYHLICG